MHSGNCMLHRCVFPPVGWRKRQISSSEYIRLIKADYILWYRGMWLLPAFLLSAECYGDSDMRRRKQNRQSAGKHPLELLPARDPDQKESNGKPGELPPPTPALSFWTDAGLQHIRHDVAWQWWQTILVKMLCCSTVSVVRGSESTS